MRKKLLLVVVSVMSLSTVYAQSDDQVEYIKVKPFTPEHEIRIGYSPLMPLIWGCDDGYSSDYSRSVGAISVLYSYKLFRWFEIGGVFSYGGEYEDYRKATMLTVAPNFRFSWFNSRVVRFYSSFALGFGIEFGHTGHYSNRNYSAAVIAFHLSPIGMSVGRKFFFYIEPFCVGTQGNLLIAGLGYRFPVKQKTVKYKYLDS